MRSTRRHQAVQVVGESTRRLGRRSQAGGAPAADPSVGSKAPSGKGAGAKRHRVSVVQIDERTFRARCFTCEWAPSDSANMTDVIKHAENHGSIAELLVRPKVRTAAVKMVKNLRRGNRRKAK